MEYQGQLWLLSVSGSALALLRGVLWVRGEQRNGGAGFDHAVELRDGAKTLALVERQADDLRAAIAVLRDQQQGFQANRALLDGMTNRLGQIATALDRTVGHLTGIGATSEMTLRELELDRDRRVTVARQVAEVHAQVMKRDRNPIKEV